MPAKHSVSLRRCYGIFFLILTLLLGVAFILQATDIYFGALETREAVRAQVTAQAVEEGWSESVTRVKIAMAVSAVPIYSRQIVGTRLKKLLPYVCIWLAALIGGIVVAATSTAPAKKAAPASQTMLAYKLKRDRSRVARSAKPGHETDFRDAEARYLDLRKQAVQFGVIYAVLGAVCLILPLVYLLSASNFPGADITAEVKAAAVYVLPFLLVLLSGGIAYVFVMRFLLQKQAEALKAVNAAGERAQAPAAAQKKFPARTVARVALLVVGLGLFVLGTQNGSMREVLTKAINICTECIGLG